MRFNVLIAHNKVEKFVGFNQFVKSRLDDININFSSNGKEVLLNAENSNLIILNLELENCSEIITTCEDLGIYLVFISDDEDKIKKSDKHFLWFCFHTTTIAFICFYYGYKRRSIYSLIPVITTILVILIIYAIAIYYFMKVI